MDALIAIPLLIALAYPFFRKKMWRWIGLIVLICIYEGALEIFTGDTLSQEFWHNFEWKLVWILLGAWILLLIHLAWKRIRGKE